MSDLVLVIDDDATLLGLLAQHLSRAAYHVITAVSGISGLQMFYEHHPNLVILDIMMPKMDGWTVCERIRETSDVPIIMLSVISGFTAPGCGVFSSRPIKSAASRARL